MENFLILLPTRRAIRSLCDAFLKTSKGKPLILPSIIPLGDLDEEEIIIKDSNDASNQLDGTILGKIPDAISNLHRQLILTTRINSLGQRNMGIDKGIVMEGRDIGSVVFPAAELKLFITADTEISDSSRNLLQILVGAGSLVVSTHQSYYV